MALETEQIKKEITHTLSALVANKPGVLARIAQVFSRRGFNIDSLVVSAARDGDFSRMTITLTGDPAGLDQIIKQVNKLVDIIHCYDHTGSDIIVKELLMVKVVAGKEMRSEILQLAEHFAARSVDLTENSVVLMVTGSSEKLDAFTKMFKAYEIIEMIRTGKVIMSRGAEET